MVWVTARELSSQTRTLLDRVEAGEQLTSTVDDRPVALLRPVCPQLPTLTGPDRSRPRAGCVSAAVANFVHPIGGGDSRWRTALVVRKEPLRDVVRT